MMLKLFMKQRIRFSENGSGFPPSYLAFFQYRFQKLNREEVLYKLDHVAADLASEVDQEHFCLFTSI